MNLTHQERVLIIIALTEKRNVAWEEAAKHRETDSKLADFWDSEADRIEVVADKFRLARI